MVDSFQGNVPAPPRLTVDNGQFDAVVRDILEIIDDFASDSAPTMATVVGISGGRVVCHIDGELLPRTVGFAKRAGTHYQVGHRVKLSRTRSGEWIVDGLITTSSTDNSVGNDQIAPRSVGYWEMAEGQIAWEHLSANLQTQINNLAQAPGPTLAQFQTIRDRV